MYGRRQRFVHGLVAWFMLVLVGLAVADALDPVTFYVLALAGFLVLVETATPTNRLGRWQDRLRWVVLFGLLGAVAVGAVRLAATLPAGVF